MDDLTAIAVIAELERQPVSLVSAVAAAPEGAPSVGGFYAWWSQRGAIAHVPERLHPLDASLTLLYVGISPANMSSQQTLRGRLLGNHICGNTSSSTFRFTLASLLLAELDLRPRRTAKKVVLDAADNVRLRAWQFANLRLSWCACEHPWEIEHEVIQTTQPPLNAAGNSAHPFYTTVKASRAAFRAAALPAGRPDPKGPDAQKLPKEET